MKRFGKEKHIDKTHIFFSYRLFISFLCASVRLGARLFHLLHAPSLAYAPPSSNNIRFVCVLFSRRFCTGTGARHRRARLRPNTIYINSVFDIAEMAKWGGAGGGQRIAQCIAQQCQTHSAIPPFSNTNNLPHFDAGNSFCRFLCILID